MSALGESFRTARESQGFSLSDVADRIHIRSLYLAAIEAEDWVAIGPAVYVRGFLRNYARFLQLDPDAAVAAFNESSIRHTAAAAALQAPATRVEPSRSGLGRGRPTVAKTGPSPGAIVGVIVAFALVAFVGYQYVEYARGNVSTRHEPVAAVQPSVPPAKSQAMAVARVGHRADRFAKPSGGLGLRLKDGSWLRVVIDGKVTMEGVYPAGTERSFSGRSATIRTGNAGGVDVTLAGKDLGPMGGLGDVAERSFQL